MFSFSSSSTLLYTCFMAVSEILQSCRAAPAEFVVPLAKYTKAMYAQVSLGMRFRMIFETEECGVRRYMGTVTGISDLDPVRWKSSQWRNLQVLMMNAKFVFLKTCHHSV